MSEIEQPRDESGRFSSDPGFGRAYEEHQQGWSRLETNNETFRNRYVRAREGLMDYYAEQILVIAFDESGDIILEHDGARPITNHAKVQRDRLKADSLKWTASRLFPKRYGDKMELLGQGNDREAITVRWIANDPAPVQPPPAPPKQIPYQRPEMPADLSEREHCLITSASMRHSRPMARGAG